MFILLSPDEQLAATKRVPDDKYTTDDIPLIPPNGTTKPGIAISVPPLPKSSVVAVSRESQTIPTSLWSTAVFAIKEHGIGATLARAKKEAPEASSTISAGTGETRVVKAGGNGKNRSRT